MTKFKGVEVWRTEVPGSPRVNGKAPEDTPHWEARFEREVIREYAHRAMKLVDKVAT